MFSRLLCSLRCFVAKWLGLCGLCCREWGKQAGRGGLGGREGGLRGWKRGFGVSDGGRQVGKWGSGVPARHFRTESGLRTGLEAICCSDGTPPASGNRRGRTERGVPGDGNRGGRTDGVCLAEGKRVDGTGGRAAARSYRADGIAPCGSGEVWKFFLTGVIARRWQRKVSTGSRLFSVSPHGFPCLCSIGVPSVAKPPRSAPLSASALVPASPHSPGRSR